MKFNKKAISISIRINSSVHENMKIESPGIDHRLDYQVSMAIH